MRYVVLDAETNILNRGDRAVGDMHANPFFADNHIVALGELWLSKKKEASYNIAYMPEPHPRGEYNLGAGETCKVAELLQAGEDVLMIGHNLSFDILYLLKDEWLTTDMLEHLYIWDTAQVEYLIEGQRHFYPSLDECCIKRGLPVKDNRIKEQWDQGIDTSLIEKELLLDYLKADLDNTLAVFQDQYKLVSQTPKLFELIKVKMDDIIMTTMMTWHGMKFDLQQASKTLEPMDEEIAELTKEITELGQNYFESDFQFNPESPTQMSLLLYGGDYKIVRDIEQIGEDGLPIRFKGGQRAGQVKTKKTPITYHTAGIKQPTKGVPSSRDGWSTSEEHLAKMKHPVAAKVLRLRELMKDAETYYRGYSKLVWPDGLIHPQRNHTSTVTGRLSCSSPNLENVSKPDED
jgi:DNA polymerase I-like protein with 3'-5' exonuclease and polymerase domains